jgi:hypothetical protein
MFWHGAIMQFLLGIMPRSITLDPNEHAIWPGCIGQASQAIC